MHKQTFVCILLNTYAQMNTHQFHLKSHTLKNGIKVKCSFKEYAHNNAIFVVEMVHRDFCWSSSVSIASNSYGKNNKLSTVYYWLVSVHFYSIYYFVTVTGTFTYIST